MASSWLAGLAGGLSGVSQLAQSVAAQKIAAEKEAFDRRMQMAQESRLNRGLDLEDALRRAQLDSLTQDRQERRDLAAEQAKLRETAAVSNILDDVAAPTVKIDPATANRALAAGLGSRIRSTAPTGPTPVGPTTRAPISLGPGIASLPGQAAIPAVPLGPSAVQGMRLPGGVDELAGQAAIPTLNTGGAALTLPGAAFANLGKGHEYTRTPTPAENKSSQQLAALSAYAQQLDPTSPERKVVDLMIAMGEPSMSGMAGLLKPDTNKSMQQQLLDAKKRGDAAEIKRITEVINAGDNAQALRMVYDKGLNQMVWRRPTEGALADLPPTQGERGRDSAMATAMPMIKRVDELSALINTKYGPAALTNGGVRMLQAKAQNDPDVAELMTYVEGPLKSLGARAIGREVGNLNQQEQEAAIKIFPMPWDSKELRDRKIRMLEKIVHGFTSSTAPVKGADLLNSLK